MIPHTRKIRPTPERGNMTDDPRAQVCEMIADVLGTLEPCRHTERDGTCHRCAAVQVMGLFTDVIAESPWMRPGYAIVRIPPTKEHTDG